MINATVASTRKGNLFGRLMRELEKKEDAVYVGFLKAESESSDRTGADNIAIATQHEFGATIKKGNKTIEIPSRPFMRWTMEQKRDEINNLARKLVRKIIRGELGKKQGLERLGVKVQSLIKSRIEDLKTPPLAPSTIARRKNKSDNPLVDTGQMINAVHYEVREK